MIMLVGADKILDIRGTQVAVDIIHESKRLSKISPKKLGQIIKEQTKILNGVPCNALTSLKELLKTAEDRRRVHAMAEQIAGVDTILAENEKGLLDILKRLLS